jgi:hypothetical protein
MSEDKAPPAAEQTAGERAHEWLKTAIGEFHGALEELGEHMAHDTADAAKLRDEVSATLNLFMVDLMRIASHGAPPANGTAEQPAELPAAAKG